MSIPLPDMALIICYHVLGGGKVVVYVNLSTWGLLAPVL